MLEIPELSDFKKLEDMQIPGVHFETLGEISFKDKAYPVRAVTIGSPDKSLPTMGLFGGVHGLERIGSQVIISFLHTLLHQLTWNQDLVCAFEHFRIVSIPIINPAGMANSTRSNPNSVDLMRNAPVEAEGNTSFLISGHRLSPSLPWYRGKEGGIEKEAEMLIDFVKREIFPAQVGLCLDVHSGFGLRDQIWYPYAKKRGEFPREKEALNLKGLLDKTYPHHVYKYEPQALNYITHGDLWDYLFDVHAKELNQQDHLFLPLTLELGSWNWIKKNPLQFFSKTGLFHPIKVHRQSRTMRRHLILLDFLTRAVRNHQVWTRS